MLEFLIEVSVIIPVFDRKEFINDAVKSVIVLDNNMMTEILIVSNIDLKLAYNNTNIRLILNSPFFT